MSDKEKAFGIGAAVLAIVALIFLFRRGSSNTVVRQQTGTVSEPQEIVLQQVNFERVPFVIPPLEIGERWQSLSAIGACCADCSGARPRQSFEPAGSRGPTIVFNEGNRGPNVFNYFTPPPPPPSRGYVIVRQR